MRKDLTTSLLAVVVMTVFLGLAYPLAITGISQVVFPGKADGSQGQGRRQGRRLQPDRPGLRMASGLDEGEESRRPGYFHPRPSATDTPATSPSSATSAPTASKGAKRCAKTSPPTSRLEKPYDQRPDQGPGPGRRGHPVGLRGRPPHLRGQRPDPGAPDRRRPPAAAGPGRRPDRRQHRRPLPRPARRARRQRPRAQHRPRRGSAGQDDRRDASPARCFDPEILRPALLESRAQARPAGAGPQPGDVRGRDRRPDHHRRLADPGLRRRAARRRPRALLVHLQRHRLALADGRLRQPRRGAGRGTRPRPGGEPAGDADRDHRAAARRRREAGRRADPRRRRRGRGGGADPRRRHRDRGHRLGRRVGDHRRVGAGDPRGRRRPLAPSPAAPGCSPTGSSSRSPRSRANPSSTG